MRDTGPPAGSPSGSSDPLTPVSLSEVIGTLSYALDLTEGQPEGHGIRCCLIGMRMGRALGLGDDRLSELYYTLLLKDAGCSANASETAALFASDDHAVKRNLKTVDWTHWLEAFKYALRNAAMDGSLADRIRTLVGIGRAGDRGANHLVRVRCERGADIARKIGFPEATAEGIRSLDEHWDGAGNPDGLEKDAIPLFSRIALLAQTLDVFVVAVGREEALEVMRRRAGTWFDPELVGMVTSWSTDADWWAQVYGPDPLPHLQRAEPEDRVVRADAARIDLVAEGFADIIDAKSPFTYRHSAGVADFTRALARRLDFGEADVTGLYRAGLLHDIGKLAVSNRILDKDGPLDDREFRIIRTHPVYTWNILARVSPLAGIARTAAVHHERLDGRGYPWALEASVLDRGARILAVSDVLEALTAERPYRGAMPAADALAIIRKEMALGLDGEVLDATEEAIRVREIVPVGDRGTPEASGP